MAYSKIVRYNATGDQSLYAIIRAKADGKVWNGTALVTWVDGNITAYDVALTFVGGDGYGFTIPADLPIGATYIAVFYRPTTPGTPAISDYSPEEWEFTWGGTIDTVTPSAAGTNQTTIGELVTILGISARNSGITDLTGSAYELTEKHLAIRAVLNDFIRRTRCTRQQDTVDIEENEQEVDFSGVDGFDADRIIESGIAVVQSDDYSAISVVDGIDVVGLDQIREETACGGTSTGTPRIISFAPGFQSATVYPSPVADGELTFIWSPFLTAFTLGDDSNDTANTVINVPGDLAIQAVRTGGVLVLEQGQLENVPLTNPLRSEYEALVSRSMGLGGLGVRSVRRQSVSRRSW